MSTRPVDLGAVAALFLAAIALRPQLLAIGPLLPLIRDDLALSAGAAGLLTTIPVLCMGLFAPVGPRIVAALGTRRALAACLVSIAVLGLLRAAAPAYPLVLAATLGIGVAIGTAGAIPAVVVSQHLASRPALGTGAYAGGIVAGSTLAAALAVPLAIDGSWRASLVLVSIAGIASAVAWLVLLRGEHRAGVPAVARRRLPWRRPVAWLLVLVFGLQSLMFYSIVSWVPNAFVERGWSPAAAGGLIAIFNGVGLATTIGVPLLADRFPSRRPALVVASATATAATVALIAAPGLAAVSIAILGLAIGAVFPLALTLPLDVAREPAEVGSVAALMLLGGYLLSSTGPFVLGVARDLSGDFGASLWLIALLGGLLAGACALLAPGRLSRGPEALPASAP